MSNPSSSLATQICDWSNPLLKPFQPPILLADNSKHEFRRCYEKSSGDFQADLVKLAISQSGADDIELPIGITHALTLREFDMSCECSTFFESLEGLRDEMDPESSQLQFPAIAHILFSGHMPPPCFSNARHHKDLASWLFRLSHEAAEQFAEIFGEASHDILSPEQFVKTAHSAVSCILGTSSYFFTFQLPPSTSSWISYPEFRKHGIQRRDFKANALETRDKVRIFISHDWISTDHPDPNNSTMARIESEIDYILQVSRFVIACRSDDFVNAYNQFILDYVDGDHPSVAQYSQWLLELADKTLSTPRDHMMVWSAMRAAGITDRPLVEEDIMIWYDYLCLPQVPRTDEQQQIFKSELPKVNELIQSALLLVVASRPAEQYLSRGWCLSEAILSETDTPLHISKFLRSPLTENQDELNDMRNRIRCACLMHGSPLEKNKPGFETFHHSSSSSEAPLPTAALEIQKLLLTQGVTCTNGSDLGLLSQVLAERTKQGFFPIVNHFNESQMKGRFPIDAREYLLHCMGDWSLSMNIVHAFMQNNEISSSGDKGYVFEIRVKADPSKGLPGLFIECVHRADALRLLIPDSHRLVFKRMSDVLNSVRKIRKKLVSMASPSSSTQSAVEQLQELKQTAADGNSASDASQPGQASTVEDDGATGSKDFFKDDYSTSMKLQETDIATLRSWLGFSIVFSEEGITAQELYQLVCQKDDVRTIDASPYCKIVEGETEVLMQQLQS